MKIEFGYLHETFLWNDGNCNLYIVATNEPSLRDGSLVEIGSNIVGYLTYIMAKSLKKGL